ncbi:MAG: DNA helicase RecQ [bacterium]|nr:DNA helicase RecQ [bacterium]
MERAKKILKEVFGYETFRSLQDTVIGHVLDKKDALVIMPTGGGKSLCYQIPGLIFEGLTIVVSPLISLMKDQVEQLNELGAPAIFLNSTLSQEEYRYNVGKLRRSEVKLLYLAPEALLKPWMLEMLSDLPVNIDCLTIDEAHCISEWGHDFRPEYRQITAVRDRFPDAVCIALTATATPRVREDIKKSLHVDASAEFIDSFDRPNLFLRIVPKRNPTDQVMRMLKKYPDQSGIIYCFSRRQVDELSARLAAKGYSVRPYHAGLPEKDRKENQELFIRDDVQIIVATIAFGMGINKSNIRFVIHYDLPKNIESYYQEIGRAGRDGVRAYCLLLFGYGDIQKIKYFIDQKEGQEQRMAQMHLNTLLGFAETDLCRRNPLLTYFGEHYEKENCNMCDNCTRDEKDLVDITVPAQKFLSCIRKTRQIFGAGHISDILRGSRSQKVIKFHHQELSTYGIGKDLSKQQWFHLSRQFIQKGLLVQDQEYGSLKVTPKGAKWINGRETLMGILQEEEQKTASPPAQRRQAIDPSMEYDQELFDLLRQKRKEQASLYRVAPYVIFSDKTLIHMSAVLPRTREEFLDVHGVGAAKMKKYGGIFLDVIENYCRGRGMENTPPAETTPPDYHDPPPAFSSTQLAQRTQRKPPSQPIPPDDLPAPDEIESPGPRHHQIGEAFNRVQSLEEVANQFDIKQDTVITNLLKYLADGCSLIPAGILVHSSLPPELQAKVMESFATNGPDLLAPVYNALNGQVDYKELKILKLYYLSCNS